MRTRKPDRPSGAARWKRAAIRAAVTVLLGLAWALAATPAGATASGGPAAPPGPAGPVLLVGDVEPGVHLEVQEVGGQPVAMVTPPSAVAGPALSVRFASPDDPDEPQGAGTIWVALDFRCTAEPVRSVRLFWGPRGGQARQVSVEMGGPNACQGSAWAELRDVPAGQWVAVAVAQTPDGKLATAAMGLQVVGDLGLQPRLTGLSEGLYRRDPGAQREVDHLAQSGELWRLIVSRYAAPAPTPAGMSPGTGSPGVAAGGTAPESASASPLPFAVGSLGLDAVSGALTLTNPVVLHALVQDQPQGYLAAGVRAYEAVRGAPYWVDSWGPGGVDVRRREPPGSGQYRPDEEIPGWSRFLETYAGHPAADDAAYRLGRSYEVRSLGRAAGDAVGRAADLRQAALAYLVAAGLPDGDMRQDAIWRLVYLLDAVAGSAELREMSAPVTGVPPSGEGLARLAGPEATGYIRAAAQYALALRLLREGQYAAAARHLEGLQATLHDVPLPWPGWDPLGLRRGDVTATLRRQTVLATELEADLARQVEAPEARYAEAARIYHDTQAFYLPLWHGQRATYLAFGHVFSAAAHDPRDADTLRRYVATHTTYVRALELWDAFLAATPPEPWREKALFSRAMTLYHLQGYGYEVRFWRSPETLRQEMVAAFSDFARTYPDSALADDALWVVGVFTRDWQVLQEIIRRYPDGDRRPAAERLLRELHAGLPSAPPK